MKATMPIPGALKIHQSRIVPDWLVVMSIRLAEPAIITMKSRMSEGNFVAHHLRAASGTAEERVLVVRGPAAGENSENAESVHRDDERNAHGDVSDLQVVIERNHAQAQEGRREEHHRAR